LYHYRKHKSRFTSKSPLNGDNENDYPFITVQLPIFNERYVVERLIENITRLDYPKDKFEIHVIDDSTDITTDLAKKAVQKHLAEGFNIRHITRSNRQGYKAGALKEAMKYAKGDYICIFDADFLPKTDFLRRVLPYFDDEKVGVVQTRWEHINQDYSLLTRLQAFQLNVHFTVEQKGRDAGNYMLQFNGTAGVWRRKTIEDAGGWEADTLTEDLDLSYRAQLKGWKIVFREDIGSPAELPSEMNGLKSQQFRWMKGGAETAKKMLPTVWRSSLDPITKFHATMHLLSSTVFLFVFVIGVFSVPILFFIIPLGIDPAYLSIFMLALLSIIAVYFSANMELAAKGESKLKTFMKFIFLFPVFLALSMGLSLHNSVAVIQGYWGKKSAFVRTPKFNITNLGDTFKKTDYLYRNISFITALEGILALYFAGGLLAAYLIKDGSFLMLHILLVLGYGTIFYYSVKHSSAK
jgi:cellulose synthase/poly-beta-1,6-N-acetylglucosamine synthase-like glycosyltransferase